MGLIDEKTNIPLFAVIGALPVAVGFVAWLTIIYLKSDAATVQNERQDAKIEAQYLLLLDIRDRVIKIEANQRPIK